MNAIYTTQQFEDAVSLCGYHLHRISKSTNTFVRKAEGNVTVIKRVNVSGEVKQVHKKIQVRWDALGTCFSRWTNKRYRRYDLPIKTIVEKPELLS